MPIISKGPAALAIGAAAVLTTGLLSGTAAATAPGHATGKTVYVNHEAKHGDVDLMGKKWVKHAAADPRDVNATRFTHTIDFDRNRITFFVKVDDLKPSRMKGDYRTVQYVDLFVGYKKGHKVVDAFGVGADSRHPRTNDLGADRDVVSAKCARSVRTLPCG